MSDVSRVPATVWKYQIVGSVLAPAANHSEMPNSLLNGVEMDE